MSWGRTALHAHRSTGAFVSRWEIKRDTLEVVKGEDQKNQVYRWNKGTGQYVQETEKWDRRGAPLFMGTRAPSALSVLPEGRQIGRTAGGPLSSHWPLRRLSRRKAASAERGRMPWSLPNASMGPVSSGTEPVRGGWGGRVTLGLLVGGPASAAKYLILLDPPIPVCFSLPPLY
jgi:hypothetical protein